MYREKIFLEKQGVVQSIICSEKEPECDPTISLPIAEAHQVLVFSLNQMVSTFCFQERKNQNLPSTFPPLSFSPPFGNQLKCGKAMTRFRSSKIRSIPVCIYILCSTDVSDEERRRRRRKKREEVCWMVIAFEISLVFSGTPMAKFMSIIHDLLCSISLPFVLLSIMLVHNTSYYYNDELIKRYLM